MAILTLAEAKAAVNITSEAYDAELQPYVDATSEVIESFVGPVESGEVVEDHNGGPMLVLRELPVVSLTSVSPILTDGTSYTVADLDVSNSTGVVRRLDGDSFAGPLRVTYTSGHSTVPSAINVAARVIVAHLWRTQLGSQFARGASADDLTEPLPGFGFAIPNRAMELMRPFIRPPVVG